MKKIITIVLLVFFYQGYSQDSGVQFLEMLGEMEEERQNELQEVIDKEHIASQIIPFGGLIVAGGDEYKVLLILYETSNDNLKILIYANDIDHMKLSINEVLKLGYSESLEFGSLDIQRNGENLKFDYKYRVGVKYLEELYNKL